MTMLLVKAGSDLDAKTSTGGSSPLHLAADGGHFEAMLVLIGGGGGYQRP